MGISRVYPDTYYLLEIVLKGHRKQDAEKILYKASKGSFEIVVPQIVLGEAVSKILKRGKDARRLMDRLVDTIEKYEIDAGACLAPVSKSAFEIMEEVRRRDQRLDGTDIAILAHALADPDAKVFLTIDTNMTANPAIDGYEVDLRNDGRRNVKLNVTDRI